MQNKRKRQFPAGDAEQRSLAEAVRKKPGLYLGGSGPTAIPRVLALLLDAIFRMAANPYHGPVEFSVRERQGDQEFCVDFKNILFRAFPADKPEQWFQKRKRLDGWELDIIPRATRRCCLEISDGKHVSI